MGIRDRGSHGRACRLPFLASRLLSGGPRALPQLRPRHRDLRRGRGDLPPWAPFPGGGRGRPHRGRWRGHLHAGRPRHHRATPVRTAVARGQGDGGGRQPRQVRIPGQHEPRNSHADERRHRHDRAAFGDGTPAHAARVCRDAPHQRRVAPGHHQRHPRFLEDRGGPDDPEPLSLRPAQLRRGGARSSRAQGPGKTPRPHPHRP